MTWFAFVCGLVIGAGAGLFVAALCTAASDADKEAEARLDAQGLGADDAHDMLLWAGEGYTPSNLYKPDTSRPHPGFERAMPELNRGSDDRP